MRRLPQKHGKEIIQGLDLTKDVAIADRLQELRTLSKVASRSSQLELKTAVVDQFRNPSPPQQQEPEAVFSAEATAVRSPPPPFVSCFRIRPN